MKHIRNGSLGAVVRACLADIWFVVLVGFLLQVLIMPFTINWDLLANTQLVLRFIREPLVSFYTDPLAAYPPLLYSILAWFFRFSDFLSGGHLVAWLSQSDLAIITDPQALWFLFLLKLPMILVGVSAALVFGLAFKPSQRSTALLLWLWNPVVIYLVAAWTNVDALPLLFLVAAGVAGLRNKPLIAIGLLGFAVSTKMFAIFFVPFYILALTTWRGRLTGLIVFLICATVPQLPVLTMSSYWQHTVTAGYSKKLFFSILPIGHNRALMYFFVAYTVLMLVYINKHLHKVFDPFTYGYLAILLLFTFSLFSLQWFLWLVPFLIFCPLRMPNLRWTVAGIFCVFVGMALLSPASLNIGMLAPLEPTLWKLSYPIKELIGQEMVLTLFNALHSILAALCLWMAYWIAGKEDYAQTG